MTDSSNNVADLTLERVRRLEGKFDAFQERFGVLETKIDAMMHFLKGTHSDVNGLMGLASAHEKRLDRIDARLDRIEKRWT